MQSDLAQKYWDVANAVVAFSVLQTIAFLYALGTTGFREQVVTVRPWVIAAILASSVLYSAGVVACYWAEKKLRGGEITTQVKMIILSTLYVRIAIFLLYGLAGAAVLCFGRADPQ